MRPAPTERTPQLSECLLEESSLSGMEAILGKDTLTQPSGETPSPQVGAAMLQRLLLEETGQSGLCHPTVMLAIRTFILYSSGYVSRRGIASHSRSPTPTPINQTGSQNRPNLSFLLLILLTASLLPSSQALTGLWVPC